MHISELYKQMYRRFDRLTPVPFDCGKLCGSLCCLGDEESGMYLFPGEEKLFLNKDNFSLYPTDLRYDDKTVQLVVCHGPCKREERPLSCRIFPLIFSCENNSFSVVNDPRASMCPLTHPVAEGCITAEFYNEVFYAMRILYAIKPVRRYMEAVWERIQTERNLL